MLDVEVSTTVGEVVGKWQIAATGQTVSARLLAALRRVGLMMQRTITTKAHGFRRTGNLPRATFYRNEGHPAQQGIEVRAGVNLRVAKYGRIQELGGIVSAKNGGYLTIPVGINLTANRVARVSAREFISNPSSLGFVRSFSTGRAIIGVTASGNLDVVFALARSVTIQPKGYIAASLAENLDPIDTELARVGDEIAGDLS